MIPLRIRWVGLATTRIAEDAELLGLAAQSGCKGLLIGFESISQETLNDTRKQFHAARTTPKWSSGCTTTASASKAASSSASTTTTNGVFERTVDSSTAQRSTCRGMRSMTPFPGHGAVPAAGGRGPAAAQELVAVRRRARRVPAEADDPERLQEGLEWSWRQSYGWRSLAH